MTDHMQLTREFVGLAAEFSHRWQVHELYTTADTACLTMLDPFDGTVDKPSLVVNWSGIHLHFPDGTKVDFDELVDAKIAWRVFHRG